MDKSCSNCLYGNLDYTLGYWELPDEYEIVCNYPNEGNFSKDVNKINDNWDCDGDLQEYAQECDVYTLHPLIDLNYEPIEEDCI